jgi:hypothetical protein
MPITTNQIVKDRSREIRRSAVYWAARRLSLAVLMDRGQARLSGGHSSRLAIELGLWPRLNDALASVLSSTLTNGEGGNYTGVAKPCKGAARDFEMRTNRPNTRRRNTGEGSRDNAHYKVFASPGKSRPKNPADTGSVADASRHKWNSTRDLRRKRPSGDRASERFDLGRF